MGNVGLGVGVAEAPGSGVGVGEAVGGANVMRGVGDGSTAFLTSIKVWRPKRSPPSLTTSTTLWGPSFGATQVAVVPAPTPKSPPSGACQTGSSAVSLGRRSDTVAERSSSLITGQTLATSDWPEASDTARPPSR